MNHFFDIGANIGQTFDEYLVRCPEYDGWEIWCCEPSPRHLSELRRKCEQMAETGRWRVNLCAFAIMGHHGAFELYEKTDPRGDSLFSDTSVAGTTVYNEERKTPVYVYGWDICSFIIHFTRPIDNITIKIDAEGAEFGILRRLMSCDFPGVTSRVKKILVEWHSVHNSEGGGDSTHLSKEFTDKTGIPLEGWVL